MVIGSHHPDSLFLKPDYQLSGSFLTEKNLHICQIDPPCICRLVEELYITFKRNFFAAPFPGCAEGEKKSAILVAEGEKESAILRADAVREQRIREAQGEAQAIMEVQKALADSLRLLNEAAPNDKVLALKSLEALQKVADGKATKLIIPSNIQSIAGLAASLKEVVDTDAKPKA